MKFSFFFIITFILSVTSYAQSVTITPGNNQASVTTNSTNQGMIPPKMPYLQIIKIQSPQKGTLVFDTNLNALRIFNGKRWIRMKPKGTPLLPL